MDRNSAIGMTLIAAWLLVYFYFFSAPAVPPPTTIKTDSIASVLKRDESIGASTSIDSAVKQSYGSLGSFLEGKEELVSIENTDLRVAFSTNGYIKNLELKNFKTYHQKPLYLIENGNNSFSLKAQYESKEIDLYKLFYQAETAKQGDSTVVTFSAKIGDNAFIKHIYSLPVNGFKVGYRFESAGITFAGKNLSFQWVDPIALQEKDLADSRTKTTIGYYLTEGKFDHLGDGTEAKDEILANPVKWVSIRQKFFISSIIAQNNFAGGELKISTNTADSSVVKNAQLELFIPSQDVASKKASFQYFFGPNDHDIITKVTTGFEENLSLGWPPMSWINRFVIIPVFHFLESKISNYGLIIILLVLMVKIVLLPLSYTSYLGMAKMKLLKPEMDAIKEKNGDNMAQSQQDTMKLYKQAGVNPFSGCIPLLLQMPILFAMFYFFPISIGLRQKQFLWAEDLSTYDSVLDLPFTIPFYGDHVSLFVLLMTISTLIYTWQNNQLTNVTGPMKTMGLVMPIILVFVLNSFSAGLSFYYFVSNLITFAQQAIIKRFVDEDKIKVIMEENKKKAATGTTKKSKFMTKLEEAMKASEESRKAAETKKKSKK
jgi:YidC/Oxa1 family membrane protein insertase